MAKPIQEICAQYHCHFFDAASVACASKADGVHMDEENPVSYTHLPIVKYHFEGCC